MQGPVKLYYNPQSRAAIVRWMLEEVGAEYTIMPIDFEAGDNRTPEFLAINPLGKIPALVLADGTVITEAPAIIAWLADAFPDAGLAPAKGSGEAGAYYRWLFFGGSCFEPALTEEMMRKGQPSLPKASIGWGAWSDVVALLERAVAPGPYLLGERFSAADVYIGAQLSWAGMFKAPGITDSEAIQNDVARVTDRDAYRRAMQG
ncbi:glutathione S-transferase [Aureimonas sp. SA4125]|uniref:glutathione S-transferase family protein n=1 Tax=Aureimonas sp. SA4125 TaxID=2826993 RepID=UPI001CC4B01C|nr:glutathione S-transferase family protein [Aureimonas sp. SA4125]BDA87012.1 glutathione S-transferase [Aureimonas sp. SA4125]